MGGVMFISLFFLSLSFVIEGCERRQQEHFTTVLRGDTYTKGENSSLYYHSSGDTIRVDFHLPEGRPVSLESLVVVPVGVAVFKTKFVYLTETVIKRYINPTSGEQLQAEVSSTRAVSRLTLVAKATLSSDVTMSLVVGNVTGCAWECEKKDKHHFSVTLRGHTYTKTDNSMVYYSTGDTIRVDFYLPQERPVTLQYMQMIPTNVSLLKIKLLHLNHTKTLSFSNPASGELLRARVSQQVVSKLTVVARVTDPDSSGAGVDAGGDGGGGGDAVSLLIHNLTACSWVLESTATTPPPSNKTMTSLWPNPSEPRTSSNYVTSTSTSLLPSNSSEVSKNTDTQNHINNNHNTTRPIIENFIPNIWMHLNASNSSMLPQSFYTHDASQSSTSKPIETTAFAVENARPSAPWRKNNETNATSGDSVTSLPELLEKTDGNELLEETKVEEEENRILDKPEADLSEDSVVGIVGAVFAFVEVVVAALVLVLQRHTLCPAHPSRPLRLRKSRVSIIQQV